MTDKLQSGSDSQSAVILQMEKKLNPSAYWRRLWSKDKYCSISTAQYWDWLTFIDVSMNFNDAHIRRKVLLIIHEYRMII